jgi:hypothetical protein
MFQFKTRDELRTFRKGCKVKLRVVRIDNSEYKWGLVYSERRYRHLPTVNKV